MRAWRKISGGKGSPPNPILSPYSRAARIARSECVALVAIARIDLQHEDFVKISPERLILRIVSCSEAWGYQARDRKVRFGCWDMIQGMPTSSDCANWAQSFSIWYVRDMPSYRRTGISHVACAYLQKAGQHNWVGEKHVTRKVSAP